MQGQEDTVEGSENYRDDKLQFSNTITSEVIMFNTVSESLPLPSES